MSLDLKLLVWSVVLTIVQCVIAVFGSMLQVDLPTLAGNRDNFPTIDDWAGRAERAHRNMLENLVLFAALVLVAHVAGRANAMTALGAQLFFWAGLAYLPIYLIGIPWTVSILGRLLFCSSCSGHTATLNPLTPSFLAIVAFLHWDEPGSAWMVVGSVARVVRRRDTGVDMRAEAPYLTDMLIA